MLLQVNDTILVDTTIDVESPQGNFNYKIRTPSRTIFSAAGIIGERAIVALDYEAVDLTKGTLKADKYGFDMENDLVQNLFQSVRTIRIGAEYKLNDFWVIRGGFAHFSSPIKREFVRTMPSRNSVSLGLGYRTKNFFWDVAFVNTSWAEDIYLYDPNLIDAAKANYNQVQLLSTFGFRF
jgi:long-subunit fatty acid transport protein